MILTFQEIKEKALLAPTENERLAINKAITEALQTIIKNEMRRFNFETGLNADLYLTELTQTENFRLFNLELMPLAHLEKKDKSHTFFFNIALNNYLSVNGLLTETNIQQLTFHNKGIVSKKLKSTFTEHDVALSTYHIFLDKINQEKMSYLEKFHFIIGGLK